MSIPDVTLLSGVPGVGKTTALQKTATTRSIVNLGTAMLQAAAQRGLDIQRDVLRSLPKILRDELRSEAIGAVPTDAILDIHLSIPTDAGLEASVPDALLRSGRVKEIIILETDALTVASRRYSRRDRDSPHQFLHEIELHQEFNRRLAIQWSKKYRFAHCVLHVNDYTTLRTLLEARSDGPLGA